MPQTLPADPDDYDVRAARRRATHARHRHRLRDPPAAWLCNCRRPAGVAGPDFVHHTCGLHLHGQAQPSHLAAATTGALTRAPTTAPIRARRRGGGALTLKHRHVCAWAAALRLSSQGARAACTTMGENVSCGAGWVWYPVWYPWSGRPRQG